ncbi:hypothetical protein LB524_16675 [Mesorhizobium sp. ESP6-5]|uniref:hypothetical protein n=1 Tax=unclassified Mesorhizobium TaxID=325217 RepID=UPI00112C3F10|nr:MULTISPECIES: hypothetical protein [unclassified Mesorhizobium]MBZ9683867.1 hypothetical protein [Mesorhizobium sp. CO1-1-2]MBZ9696603.1 hypothetical protein [Mesorhizobium sp. CO1-1-9]MBZ9725406.1 hypothetical protein [Mesorhizobium sp. CO1-1-11]MBZ9756927.1 hypothetical protein [Mesorhizobium sp. ESP6-5]MBZ9923659.1 hypothetical protein [Mesorhizobium sp. BR1-1-4]
MSTQLFLTSRLCQSFWSEQPTWTTGPASVWARLIALRGLVAVWRERMYYREELKRLAEDGPQRIDDVGLTLAAVEADLQKPFWQA